jgi:osmotically inducible lipoprotein OsmB
MEVFMHTHARMIAVMTLCAFVAACGNTPGQRALSGGAIGAGAGAVGAAVLNANPVTGAIVGGAVGAVTGAATTKKQIDLGDIR